MSRRGVDISTVKKNNKKLILRTIFEKGVVSRTEISKTLSISKPAVNEHIDQLLGIGVIREIGEGAPAKRGGRRPILIEPDPDYKINIALDLNFTKPQLAIGTVTGAPIDRVRLESTEPFTEFCDALIYDINSLLNKHDVDREKLGVIVISTPGIINEITGEIHVNSQFKSRNMFVLKRILEASLGVKVILKNDVNMAALAEASYLKKDILFVSCGLGVGAAIVSNGKLYEGSTYAAGEIGYFMDGSSGMTLEESICINYLLKRLKIDTFDNLIKAYDSMEKCALDAIRKVSRKLGVAINNLVSVCDIQTVVVGGDYLVFGEIIFQEIEYIMKRSKLPVKPEICTPALQDAGGIIGCFAVATKYVTDEI